MKKFMDENFLLETETAQKLIHEVAKDQPIYDYHCHLIPEQILEDKKFKNITEVWLGGDHYKWRLMRWMGVPEEMITGTASDYDKFLAYAKAIQYAAGNPLYHWSHLELQRFFGIYEPLTEQNAPEIWEKANAIIASEDFSARKLIEKSNVAFIGTTDDPTSDLHCHIELAKDESFKTVVKPTFRPDPAVNIRKEGFSEYIEKLGAVCGFAIQDMDGLYKALESRISFFHEVGSRISDHGIVSVPYATATDAEVDAIFKKALSGETVSEYEEEQYQTAVMLFCGREYAKRGWVMQLHAAAIRNNNTPMFKKLGPDTGFDSILNVNLAEKLSRFLDTLITEGNLPKTILYSLNPTDNSLLVSMAGNFEGDGVKGKIQHGSAWWFNDHIDGMVDQMKTLGNLGALASFVGMLTDSRSFLSYPRHEYFRRILCNIIGEWVEKGMFTSDRAILDKLIADICFCNAKNYFLM